MGLQEMAWRIWPQYYERLDVLYQKIMFPMFCRKARHFFPWSRFQLDEISGYLKRKLSNASITPPAVPDKFHIINDSRILKEYQIKYNLPDKFIFAVTRVDHPGVDGSSSFFPGKNVDTTVKAYIRCKKKIPHELVIAGRRVREYLAYRGFSERDLSGIRFLGFVPHDHLPMLFNLAQLFIMPSLLEGFGLTLLEAMACGCPAIVSKTGSCPELGGEAVILADPCDPTDFSEKVTHVLGNVTLRGELQQKGLERASFFIWERSARLTIEGLTFAAGKTAV
jgi:glycosyltransferase involved in cell wall biosynthesis